MKRFTRTKPAFWIALHNPGFDMIRWVSIMDTGEYYEKGLTSIFHNILSTYDLSKEPRAPLVIDIGMNIGWFSLYSRAHGHDVATFEPNPVMFLRICESLGYNKWGSSDDVSLWMYGLGFQKGFFNLTTGNYPGGSSFFQDRLPKEFRTTIPVEVTTLDTVAVKQGWLDRKVSLMKVDVEGFEPYVFEGGKRLLHEGHVENIIMENSVTDITKGKCPSYSLFLVNRPNDVSPSLLFSANKFSSWEDD
jgi:FkbM family methyltransferase